MFFTSIKLRFTNHLKYVGLLLCLTVHVHAQIVQSERFEIPIGENEPTYTITPADNNGLFLHRYFTDNEKGQVDILKLDTAFKEQWHGLLKVDPNQLFVGKRSFKGQLYFLLRNQLGTAYQLFVLSEEDGHYTEYNIHSFIRFNTTEFQVTDDAVLIGGYFNRIPLVLHYSIRTQQSKVLPGIFNEEGELTQIKTYPDGSFHVLINSRNVFRQKTIWIKNYSADGMLINNYALKPDDNKSLLFARSLRTSNNMQIVSGVYANRKSEYSRGIFLATIDPNGLQQIRYYNYGDFDNFFNYMKAKRETRVKERIDRRKIKGKMIRFNYRMLVHELIEDNGQYILLGEAFYPQYTSVSQSSRGYKGFFQPYSPYTPSYIRGDQVFDGYRYTHAVILGFNADGRLLWDNSFEINDVKTYTLEQYVKLGTDEDKIVLLYLFDNQIRSKIIKGDQVLEGKTQDPLKTMYPDDILVNDPTNYNQLSPWYADYFYAFGIQNIINTANQTVPKRRVFYVNKIAY